MRRAITDLVRLVGRRLAKLGHLCTVEAVPVDQDKVTRALVASGRGKLGMQFADREAPWWPVFLGELLTFPNGAHDDQVDVLSRLVARAARVGALDVDETWGAYGFRGTTAARASVSEEAFDAALRRPGRRGRPRGRAGLRS